MPAEETQGLDQCYRNLLCAVALQAYNELLELIKKRNTAKAHKDFDKARQYQLDANEIIRWFDEDGLGWGSKVEDSAEKQAVQPGKPKHNY